MGRSRLEGENQVALLITGIRSALQAVGVEMLPTVLPMKK
jgi:hypothetical protein